MSTMNTIITWIFYQYFFVPDLDKLNIKLLWKKLIIQVYGNFEFKQVIDSSL